MTAPKATPLPATVKVGAFLYTISAGGPDWDRARLAENLPDLQGHTNHSAGVVSLPADLAASMEREVVLHEILHCCAFAAGSPLGAMSSNDPEEDAVRILAPTLLGVLRDNPDLLAYLTAP